MYKTLREWFEWSDEHEPTGKIAEWHRKVLDYLDCIDDGETTIDGKPTKAALIWSTVNYINALGEELEDDNRYYLENLINLIFVVIRHMSFLTYREILELFPVWIPPCENEGNRYFDGKDVYFDNELSAFNSPSLDSISLLTLCSSGIHFSDDTEGTTDFDTQIGDNVMGFVTNNHNPTLRDFYLTSIYANNALWRAVVTSLE